MSETRASLHAAVTESLPVVARVENLKKVYQKPGTTVEVEALAGIDLEQAVFDKLKVNYTRQWDQNP